jgi:APA family basic amino acid/polyamine antiporter
LGYVDLSYKLGLGIAIALCLGSILGDTLFMFAGVPIVQVGSQSIVAYVVVGIVIAVIATQLGELGSIMPHEKGGPYSYVSKSFGSELGFITGILLFVGYCAIVSATALGFGGYLLSILGSSNGMAQIAIAMAIIILASLINLRGIKNMAELTRILLVIALLTAVAFVAFALLHAPVPSVSTILQNTPTQNGLGAFFVAITAIVFAYSGFQVIVTLTDNIKGGGRAATETMVISLLISMVVYIAVTIALMLLIPSTQSTITAYPLLYALSHVNAPYILIVLIGAGALFAMSAAMIAILFSASRLVYQIGKDGLLPRITRSFDHRKSVAPSGIWISAAVSIALLFSGSLYTILSISNFGVLFSLLMACFALVNMHRRRIHGRFVAPFYPYMTLISIAACIVFMFGLPSQSLALGVVIIALILVVYYTLVEMKRREVPRIKLFG